MSANPQRQANRLYQQDIIQRISHPFNIGVVLRSWHEAEDIPLVAANVDPIMRPLSPGEVGVSFIGETGSREVLPESELRLVDRTLQPGDICKRSIDEVRSGVVTKVRVKARLEHAVSGERVEGWWTSDEVEHSGDPDIGEYVITDDWLGQIMETYDESLVEATNGHVVRLPEISSRLFVGEKGNDIFPTSTSSSRLMNFLKGNRMEGVDTVISVKHTVYAIAWLAINQSLDAREAENKTRPPRFWYGPDIAKLTVIRGRPDLEMRVGDQVTFKDPTIQDLPVTRHGREGDSNGIVTVQTYFVAETRTSFEVLWQDGVHETVASTDIIPYYNPDEYDCWPGDQVIWKSENQSRAAIVQTVNAEERTAKILFGDTSKVDLVSVLELDPHGTPDATTDPQAMPDGLGVYRGDFVFIHKPGTTNGYAKPRVPRIGELEPWVREGQGQMRGWRKEMADIGDNLANENPKTFDVCMAHPRSGEFHWVGDVTDLKLDGMVEVTHPDFSVAIYPLERLTKLYDGIEQLEDDPTGLDAHDALDQDEVWAYGDNGIWEPVPDGEPDWEDEIDEEAEESVEAMEVESNGWDSDIYDDNMSEDSGVAHGPGPTVPLVKVDFPPLQRDPSLADETSQSGHVPWKRFDILSSAPPDHAFYGADAITPQRAFVARLAKEYRVLTTSLPDSIIVRAYEDRVDLLRSLIVGPENTPYQDAPFVIDWQLDSNFPQSPPIAHFWSWTNGNGRVNPNLYEEGKVCLSILGTWAGDKNETWNPARSSLLQALVSIQGLVLVKEPWFCEPAYEKLRGTEEASVNSRLYNEKAYVLSRGFVRRALEVPVGSLESEIRWLYHDEHRLEKVVAEAEALIETSRKSTSQSASNTDPELAVPRLTVGGIITLERTLTKLRGILDQVTEDR